MTYSGTSRVIRNDPYELRFVFPRGKNFIVQEAAARTSWGRLPVEIANHQGWAVVRFVSPETTQVTWQVSFHPADIYHYPVRAPRDVWVERVGLEGVNVRWNPVYALSAGYQVYLNGDLVGYTPIPVFPLGAIDPDAPYTVEVRAVWYDGTVSEDGAKISFTLRPMLPSELSLTELTPLRATAGWGIVRNNRAVSGKPLSIGGKRFTRGIGTHADSEIEYDLKGLYRQFSAVVGIDDGNESDRGSVEFWVYGDGKELWRSGILRKSDGPKRVQVDITGVHRLVLRVTDGGDGIDYDHADWADATLRQLTTHIALRTSGR